MQNNQNAKHDLHEQKKHEIFTNHISECHKRQLSNHENYDKTIITLASAGLALSLTILKDIVPKGVLVKMPYFLYSSWVFLGITITSVLISYLVSNKALEIEITNTNKLIKNGYMPVNKPMKLDRVGKVLNLISGGSFFIGLWCMIIFGSINFNLGENMSNNRRTFVNNGACVPQMQMVADTRDTSREGYSTTVPMMQELPQNPETSSASEKSSDENNESTKD